MADKTQTWICHHRLELTLDGEFAHTPEDLMRMGMYYHRPYFELIFVTPAEHRGLHGKGQSEETKKKLSRKRKKKKLSEEHKKKIGKALKGRKFSAETRNKQSEARKNKPYSISEFGKKYFAHFGYSNNENPKLYNKELHWYHRHNNKCSWEV